MQKALARKAELRAEKLAPEISPTEVVEPPFEFTQPIEISRAIEFPQTIENESSEPQRSGRAALSAETMSLIEHMANSAPFADDDSFNADGTLTAGGVFADGGPLAESPAAPAPLPDAQHSQVSNPAADAPPPDATEQPATGLRPSRSTGAVDAFQLLLSNNPAAGDNTRTDLRDAPALRNPRKIMLDDNAPRHPKDAQTNQEAAEKEAQEKERSFRNWFSPKSDPNPPPPPETDPTLD